MAPTTLVLLLILATGGSHAARILAIIPTPSISHQLPFRKIALELARRGHQITLITTDPIKKTVHNYTEIDVSHSYGFWKSTYDFTSMSEIGVVDLMNMLMAIGETVCDLQLSSPQVKELTKTQQSFDAVILERGMYFCYYGLAHMLGSPPLIGFVSFSASAPVYDAYDNPNNPAYLPDVSLGYSEHMSFWERLHNMYVQAVATFMWHWILMPRQQAMLPKYFDQDIPPVQKMERNFSLLLLNNHFSMNYPRPLLPNIVELTGLHLENELQPLPKDIKGFLDGAENGVKYFSLGSNVQSSAMPEEKHLAFLEAFARIPQRVLWKWEADDLPYRPDNIMTAKWLPQTAVLAHPNVRLFITQGGLQSMNEAGYFAVPMIGIPFVGDQQHNVAKMEEAGIGYRLLFRDVNKESVLKAINTVLNDERYHENMRRFSAVFREHQETSLERAVWWIEYVVRHHGAPHLWTSALDLHWWQLLLLDVVAFVVMLVAGVTYLVYRGLRLFVCSASRSPKHKTA